MSDSPPPPPVDPVPTDTGDESDWSPWYHSTGCWTVFAIFGLILALGPFIDTVYPWLSFLFVLLFGWIFYLRNVLPNVSGHLATTAVFVGALAGFLGLAHLLARSFRRDAGDGATWKPRWTVAAAGVVLLTFVAGTAMVGIVHQIGWLATTDEPMWRDGGGRQSSRRSQSKYHLKEIGIGLHTSHDVHGTLPRGITYDETGRPMHSWVTPLLPYLHDGATLAYELDREQPWDAPANDLIVRIRLPSFTNPGIQGADRDDRGYPLTHYAANVRVFSSRPGMKFGEFEDGLSNTLLVGEVNANFAPWADPLNLRDPASGFGDPDDFGGANRAGGTQFLLGDGSVRNLSPDVDPKVLRALATPNGGEDVEIP